MEFAKISPDYEIVIPESIREKYNLKPDQQVAFFEKEKGVYMIVPDIPIKELKGYLEGMDTSNLREKTEREL